MEILVKLLGQKTKTKLHAYLSSTLKGMHVKHTDFSCSCTNTVSDVLQELLNKNFVPLTNFNFILDLFCFLRKTHKILNKFECTMSYNFCYLFLADTFIYNFTIYLNILCKLFQDTLSRYLKPHCS